MRRFLCLLRPSESVGEGLKLENEVWHACTCSTVSEKLSSRWSTWSERESTDFWTFWIWVVIAVCMRDSSEWISSLSVGVLRTGTIYHKIYNKDDCIIKLSNGTTESLNCPFVEYPNHPHMSCQEKCGAVLMKKVKYGSKYQLVPWKVYAYNSIKSSLTRLFTREGFALKLEKWRNRKQTTGTYTDIYEGRVWESFQTVNETPFLQAPI